MWEQFINDWKSTRSNSERICESCIHYPPSSCDEKPCFICDPHDPVLNYYCKNENMADCRKCYWRNICIRHNPFECSHFKKEYGD